MSEAPGSTQHQSRRRALILMTQTQHPCCSWSLTPFYRHTYISIYCLIPTLLLAPPLSFTHSLLHFFHVSSSPLSPSLILSSDDYDGGDSHYESQADIWRFQPTSLSLSSPFYPSTPLFFTHSLSLCTAHSLLRFSFHLSKFHSVAGRICLYSTSERKRSWNIRENVKQPLSSLSIFSHYSYIILVVNHLCFSQA